jgi:hypothetical protein
LVPVAHEDKVYNIKDIARVVGLPNAFMIGAGAASSRLCGLNCEVGGSSVFPEYC